MSITDDVSVVDYEKISYEKFFASHSVPHKKVLRPFMDIYRESIQFSIKGTDYSLDEVFKAYGDEGDEEKISSCLRNFLEQTWPEVMQEDVLSSFMEFLKYHMHQGRWLSALRTVIFASLFSAGLRQKSDSKNTVNSYWKVEDPKQPVLFMTQQVEYVEFFIAVDDKQLESVPIEPGDKFFDASVTLKVAYDSDRGWEVSEEYPTEFCFYNSFQPYRDNFLDPKPSQQHEYQEPQQDEPLGLFILLLLIIHDLIMKLAEKIRTVSRQSPASSRASSVSNGAFESNTSRASVEIDAQSDISANESISIHARSQEATNHLLKLQNNQFRRNSYDHSSACQAVGIACRLSMT